MPKVSESYLEERRERDPGSRAFVLWAEGLPSDDDARHLRRGGSQPWAPSTAISRARTSSSKRLRQITPDRLGELIAQVTAATPDAKEGLQLIGEYYYGHFHDPQFFEQARADAEVHVQRCAIRSCDEPQRRCWRQRERRLPG